MYYDSPKRKKCERGCGKEIEWKGKDETKRGSTGWFEVNTKTEHTFRRCDKLILIKAERAMHGTLFPTLPTQEQEDEWLAEK